MLKLSKIGKSWFQNKSGKNAEIARNCERIHSDTLPTVPGEGKTDSIEMVSSPVRPMVENSF